MYEYVEPVNMQCEVTGNKTKHYKRLGLWKYEEDAGNGNDPDRVLSLNYFLKQMNKEDVKHYEEHAFEGKITEMRSNSDCVVITVENEYGTMMHEFDVRRSKKEKFTKGNPNTATPGSKFYYADELDTDLADVEIIEPAVKPTVFENRSSYYKRRAEEQLE